jgi:hypothetical protein
MLTRVSFVSSFFLAVASWPARRADPEQEQEELFLFRYRPERLEQLCKDSKFTRKEIQLIYRGFKQVGVLFNYYFIASVNSRSAKVSQEQLDSWISF